MNKKIFALMSGFLMMTTFVLAGNGNPPCNCSNNDQVDMHAAGTAVWVNSHQIKCDGESGICWSITYAGKWILTINTEPPIVFDNHGPQTDTPLSPQVSKKEHGYTIYDIDQVVWTQK